MIERIDNVIQELTLIKKELERREVYNNEESHLNIGTLEKRAIKQALIVSDYNREGTASLVGISQRTLYRKIKEYELKPEDLGRLCT
jgi:transcriptional regulator with PAS, ATPase and Fis domain